LLFPTDSDDPIFPRQVTRLGQRYQAVVPTWEEQQVLEKARAANTTPDEDCKYEISLGFTFEKR
jgi:hypothetical protein